jgi:Fe-S-cluster containining protein
MKTIKNKAIERIYRKNLTLPEAMWKHDSIQGLTRSDSFYFVCQQCSSCCRDKKIQVNPYEVARLAAHFSLTTTDFLRFYTEKGVYLQRRSDGTCVFLCESGCAVYSDRPLVCRLYPLGRYVSADGHESFKRAKLVEKCQGRVIQEGTIETYLRSQNVESYLKAADLYLGLFARLATALRNSFSHEGVVVLPEWIHVSPGDDLPVPLPDLLDVDKIIGETGGSCISVQGDPFEKMLIHIKIIEEWFENLQKGGSHGKR